MAEIRPTSSSRGGCKRREMLMRRGGSHFGDDAGRWHPAMVKQPFNDTTLCESPEVTA